MSDAEAAVARVIPHRVSRFLRDRWQTWDVFNKWTWALVAPGLAVKRFDLLCRLLDARSQHLDVPYHPAAGAGEGPPAARRLLDIYHHGEHASSMPLKPVVVFVHGGAWSHGSKELFRLLGKNVRDQGYVAVVVGYRRYPLGVCWTLCCVFMSLWL